ncbi:sigma-54-dependent Fis family transcriptional regulator [bacterium]|nr:sigma-54-dependent Fis family transcriptional regulator [candidate division CSSED10-310 bacterium]
MLTRIVVAVESRGLQERLRGLLLAMDTLVTSVPVGVSAVELVKRIVRETADLIIVSRSVLTQPLPVSIGVFRDHHDKPDIVVLRDDEDAHERARLLALGVTAVVYTGVSDDALQQLLRTVINRRIEGVRSTMVAERVVRRSKLSDFASASPVMNAFLDVVQRILDTDTTLLLLGETGVGKEHLARAIHAESRRSRGAFVAINCGALPDTLLESELFGHEEGAFTGAARAMRGQFELAHHGTVFLDEIAELPVALQVKLLQVLENRRIRRLGGERTIDIDVRIMAATNRNLTEEIARGRFRLDLFYRLSALTLNLPPLRERREDIRELVENYIRHFYLQAGKSPVRIADAAVEALIRYNWPGNVRELINVIERSVLLCDNNVVTLKDLPGEISGIPLQHLRSLTDRSRDMPAIAGLPDWSGKSLREARRAVLAQFEQVYLDHLLTLTCGRVGDAAHMAGISTRSLFDMMKRTGISKEIYRSKTSVTSGRKLL